MSKNQGKPQTEVIRVCMNEDKVWIEIKYKTKTLCYDVESIEMGAEMARIMRRATENWYTPEGGEDGE